MTWPCSGKLSPTDITEASPVLDKRSTQWKMPLQPESGVMLPMHPGDVFLALANDALNEVALQEKLISGSSFWCHCPGAFIRRLCKPSLSCCFRYSHKLFLCKIRVVETDSRLSTWPIPRQISKSSCIQPDLAFVLNIHLQCSFPLKDVSSILWEFPTTYFDHIQPLPQTIPRSVPALCSFKTNKKKKTPKHV